MIVKPRPLAERLLDSRGRRFSDPRSYFSRIHRQRGFIINPFQFNAPATDPSFANVKLLLHLEGSNGSTSILDSGPSAATCTANGGASLSTTRFKYGTSSLFLDGTNDVVTTTRVMGITTGQFTLEACIRPTGAQTGRIIGAQDPTSVNGVIFLRVDSAGSLTALLRNSAGAGTMLLTSATGLVAMNDTVYPHVALTRDASNLVNIWLEGTSVASATSATSPAGFGTNFYVVGNAFGTAGGASEYFKGYIDEVRITEGVCRYTGAFTPPTAAFPNS